MAAIVWQAIDNHFKPKRKLKLVCNRKSPTELILFGRLLLVSGHPKTVGLFALANKQKEKSIWPRMRTSSADLAKTNDLIFSISGQLSGFRQLYISCGFFQAGLFAHESVWVCVLLSFRWCCCCCAKQLWTQF